MERTGKAFIMKETEITGKLNFNISFFFRAPEETGLFSVNSLSQFVHIFIFLNHIIIIISEMTLSNQN